jgi:Zn-finger nucleic acid-binding protein
MAKSCPVCREPMREETRGEVVVDVCEHGLWLDKTELLRITEQARREHSGWIEDLMRDRKSAPRNDDRVLLCPVSGQKMIRQPYEGIQIDWSPGYGVWLDAGELEAIINNLRLQPSYLRRIALRLSDLRY